MRLLQTCLWALWLIQPQQKHHKHIFLCQIRPALRWKQLPGEVQFKSKCCQTEAWTTCSRTPSAAQRPPRSRPDSLTQTRRDRVTRGGYSICVGMEDRPGAPQRPQLGGASCFRVAGQEEAASWGRRPIKTFYLKVEEWRDGWTDGSLCSVGGKRALLLCWIAADNSSQEFSCLVRCIDA